MLTVRSTVLAAAAALVTFARADYYVVPSSVPLSLREAWCSDEKSTCPLICEQVQPGTTLVNQCDPTSLTYGCLCGNNQQPNISQYSLTLPYFVCQEWGNQCVTQCNGDSACQSACRQDHPCGALSPSPPNKTMTTTAKPTASHTGSTTIFSNLPGSNDNTNTHQGAASTMELGRSYGMVIVLVGLFAGFAAL